jgi:hypothetical protein
MDAPAFIRRRRISLRLRRVENQEHMPSVDLGYGSLLESAQCAFEEV